MDIEYAGRQRNLTIYEMTMIHIDTGYLSKREYFARKSKAKKTWKKWEKEYGKLIDDYKIIIQKIKVHI